MFSFIQCPHSRLLLLPVGRTKKPVLAAINLHDETLYGPHPACFIGALHAGFPLCTGLARQAQKWRLKTFPELRCLSPSSWSIMPVDSDEWCLIKLEFRADVMRRA